MRLAASLRDPGLDAWPCAQAAAATPSRPGSIFLVSRLLAIGSLEALEHRVVPDIQSY